MENQDELKGRNHPEVKKLEAELIKKFPALGFTGKQLRDMRDQFFRDVDAINEQHAVLEEGKGVLQNKFPGFKIDGERVWLKILGEVDVKTVVELPEKELIKLAHNYVENKYVMFHGDATETDVKVRKIEDVDESKGIEQFYTIMNKYPATKFVAIEKKLRELKLIDQWQSNLDKKSLCIFIYHLDSKSYFGKLGKNRQARLNKARNFFEIRYGTNLTHSFRKHSDKSQDQFKDMVPSLHA